MGNDDIKTVIEQRAGALAAAYTSEDLDKLMSFFSKDVDFSDAGKPALKKLSTASSLSPSPTPSLPPPLSD
jgi:hypothetical protein